jgi:hypothetical protein
MEGPFCGHFLNRTSTLGEEIAVHHEPAVRFVCPDKRETAWRLTRQVVESDTEVGFDEQESLN